MRPELSAPPPGGNPPAAAGALRGRQRFDLLRVIWVIAVGVGVLLRLYSRSALWLDETLSVNISALPVSGLLDALRHDGSPPFFYLLLHGWMGMFGTSDLAVRSLSTLVSLAALPVGYQLGRRLGGRAAGLAAVVLLATNPFLIRYATETRMYSLIVLLVLVGALLTVRAVAAPKLGRLWPVALTAGLLSLTHYWTIFLLIAAVVTLGVLGFRNDKRAYWRPAGAIVAGQILFLPWVPAFLYQARTTGTPWAPSAQLTDVVLAIRDWSGGPRWFAWPLAAALVALLVSAFRPKAPTAVRALAWCAASGLVIGLIASGVAHAGYASRYTSPSIALVLVLCGVRMSRLRPTIRKAATVLVAALGLAMTLINVGDDDRSQARVTAQLLSTSGRSVDLIVYCPDQLGPAVSRELAADGTAVLEVVYPTLSAPQRVDWVGYAARNAAADPVAVGGQLAKLSTGRIWLVMRSGYLTFGTQCEQLAAELGSLRGPATVVQNVDSRYYESEEVLEFASSPPA